MKLIRYFFTAILMVLTLVANAQTGWMSKYVQLDAKGKLKYIPDAKGNTIPDFSRVGYQYGEKEIPKVKTVVTLTASGDHDQEKIQSAIDQLAAKPADQAGIRGAILLKKGTYSIPGTLKINAGGIVIRGEGDETRLIAAGRGKRKTIMASGTGQLKEEGSRIEITDPYVPVGAKSFNLKSVEHLKAGDKIVVFRPGTTQWIQDLKMDQIEPGTGTVQWTAQEYNLEFERVITAIKGNTIYIDNPIVMAMEDQYGGGAVYTCSFKGRIAEVGIEDLYLESEYEGDTDEEHGWDAISFNKIENSWIKGVTSRYFGYSCVNLGHDSKNISVLNSKCLAPKSKIEGGRRYSFNNDGQLNLFIGCFASEGRHDYVTGAKVCGPNVFYSCTSENAKADTGPHHRWACGTLFDNIITDGEINIQDRGNWGTGHGWAGVNQVLWNCTVKGATVQEPWVSGTNYAIGLKGAKLPGRLKGRKDGIWEGQNQAGLNPSSLYLKQVEENKIKHTK